MPSTFDPILQVRAENLITQKMAEKQIPGVSVAILQNKKLAYARAFGVTNLETREPLSLDGLFHHASITKLFVGTALLQLRDCGLLNLDAPVVQYLPYFSLSDPRAGQLTIRQMMLHISGMPDTDDYGWETPQYDDGALERYVRSISNLSLLTEPGEKHAYSNIAYEVLGDVIAKVSGTSFEDYIAENILRPLKMGTATLLIKRADPALMTTPHTLDASQTLAVSPVFPYNREHAPSSTLYASALDTARFALAYLNGGELDGARILSSETIEEMWTPRIETGNKFWTKIGLSWFISERMGYKTVGHDGEDVGYNTTLVLAPAVGCGVILLSNRDAAGIEYLGDDLMDMLLAP